MTERKVLNKYFPPDYDPTKIPRLKRGNKSRQFNIRTMAPFNMRCSTCNGYVYKAKKFNSRMEVAEGVNYLGLRHYRFYIRCPTCCAEIIWRTDLESNDYIIESGAKRNFEALKTAEELEAKNAALEEEELANNPMKLLEKRTNQSKNEMETAEALDDLKELNKRQATMETDIFLLRNLWKEKEAEAEAKVKADELLIQELLASKNTPPPEYTISPGELGDIKRSVLKSDLHCLNSHNSPLLGKKTASSWRNQIINAVVKKRPSSEVDTPTVVKKCAVDPLPSTSENPLQSLGLDYSSESSEND